MQRHDLERLIDGGESATLEFKRTTGELREGLATVCAFLNTTGGQVLFGVNRKGIVEGQLISEQTLHEIAAAFDRFEPPISVKLERVDVAGDREVLVLRVESNREGIPFTFDGRAYERVGNTTRKMSQEQYETLLFERAHARRRWENQDAVDVDLEDLDREEILRTRELAIQQRRISAETSTDVGDILDRLGLRRSGVITQAAQVLYGTQFLPDYPQCLLKLGRFRGRTITGEIVDNRQEYLHAFAMVREALAFLDRTLPLTAHFRENQVFREDRLPIPPQALREVLLNAVMHRDYAVPSGAVAIVVFDDRLEIQSTGRLPNGITIDMLAGPHLSKPRNPLIANTFHRTGAVEIWGRGTNRVIEECQRYEIVPPQFEERSGSVVVTFSLPTVLSAPTRHQVGTKLALSEHQVLVLTVARSPQPLQFLMQQCGRSDRTKFRTQVLLPLLEAGLIALTIPEKPRSPQQQYVTTNAGEVFLRQT